LPTIIDQKTECKKSSTLFSGLNTTPLNNLQPPPRRRAFRNAKPTPYIQIESEATCPHPPSSQQTFGIPASWLFANRIKHSAEADTPFQPPQAAFKTPNHLATNHLTRYTHSSRNNKKSK
jgi:hypothetical protein